MSHLYHVYSICLTRPAAADTSEPPTPRPALLLAPAHLSATSGQIYFLEYNGQATPTTPPTLKRPQRKLPSWERKEPAGVFDDAPVDCLETSAYQSTPYPVSEFTLIGVCQDVTRFCRTAKSVAKFNHGTSPQAAANWVNDVLNSVYSQCIYKPIDEYNNEEQARLHQQISPPRFTSPPPPSLSANHVTNSAHKMAHNSLMSC